MKTFNIAFFSILIFSATFTADAGVQDFCVADLSLPDGPAGYSCKNPNNVTASDFFYDLSAKGNSSNLFRLGVQLAFTPQFPGANGLGVSVARGDWEVGGVLPFHTHPGGTEILLVTEGSLVSGFVSSFGNKPYVKIQRKGDIMVFPRGLAHFQFNNGTTPAVAYAFYNVANPGLQIFDNAFFANNLPSDIIVKTTLIGPAEVQRLKQLLGGTA